MKNIPILIITVFFSFHYSNLVAENSRPKTASEKLQACTTETREFQRLLCIDTTLAALKTTTSHHTMPTDLNRYLSCGQQQNICDRLNCFDTLILEIKKPLSIKPVEEKRKIGEKCQPLAQTNPKLLELTANAMNASGIETPTLFDEPDSPPSFIMNSWQLEEQSTRGPFVITPYKPNYIMPFSYSDKTNDKNFALLTGDQADNLELKYQISFKAKIWPRLLNSRGDLWIAYSQMSYWQAYNADASSAFRETNYEPELLYSWKTNTSLFGLNSRLLTFSLNHQSNGQSVLLSRSWNRAIMTAYFDAGQNFALVARVWRRFDEAAEEDDNPDMDKYIGRYETSAYLKRGRNNYSLMLRNSLSNHRRGSFQLNWSHAWPAIPMKPYIQYFYGYGDSLIDHDFKESRLSMGFLLTDWF